MPGYSAVVVLNLFISLDLRRAALFRWTMPLVAARSSALTAAVTAFFAWFGSPSAMTARAFFTEVRVLERMVLFMVRLRA